LKTIFVKLDKCVGCKSCELQCAVQHSDSKTLFGAISETPIPKQRIFVQYAKGISLPIQCRHCEDAPCVDACISGAMTKDENTNIVSNDIDRCVGCWTCVLVCPYGAITTQMDKKVALKCDLCVGLDEPACVAACHTGALVYAELSEFGKMRRREIAQRLV